MKKLVARLGWIGFVVVCLVVTSSKALYGHEPLASWAEARITSDALKIQVVLTPNEARLLLKDHAAHVPYIYPGQFDSLRALFLQYAVGDLFEVSSGFGTLSLEQADVWYDEGKDDVIFFLDYSRPRGETLTFRARYLGLMPEEHEATLVVWDGQGNSLGWDILTLDKDRFSVDVVTQEPVSHLQNFRRFLVLGIEHILVGYDHLLFLFGLIVVCAGFAEMALIVSCFTLAHSVTLALSAFNVVVLSVHIVEPLIALSIVYVGIENLVRPPRMRWVLTLVFGLVHGFGFAGVLRETGLGREGLNFIVSLFSFNLGVELGQILIAGFVLPIVLLLRKKDLFVRFGVPTLSGAVVLMGCYWFVTRVFFAS